MTRQELKKLSWDQIQGKIGKYFLISLIIGVIIGAVSSMLSFPQQIVSSLITFFSREMEYAAYITEEELMTYIVILISLSLVSILFTFIQLFVQILVSGPFYFSDANIFLKITSGQPISIGDAFSGFKTYWKAVKVHAWQTLFTTLWSFLFIIPAYVKYYAYSMAPYIALENPELSALECITRSKNMMKGHKWELFVLDLSFIGWIILSFVSCGIATIWYSPYYKATLANFYKNLKNEL